MINCLLIVALPAEARPLIDHFKLKSVESDVYRRYSSESIALVETGIGKLNAAGATAATLGVLKQVQGRLPVCLNVGLAGSALPIGTLLTAHSVVDQASGKKWFPQLTWKSNQSSKTSSVQVLTVDAPREEYESTIAFDMEAAGVFSSAVKFTTLEFIQSLKIVSDNTESPVSAINKSFASDLIEQQRDSIEHAVIQLTSLANALPDTQASTQLLNNLCRNIRCSATQKSILQSLLRQYQTCFDTLPPHETIESYTHAKALISFLESSVAAAPRAY